MPKYATRHARLGRIFYALGDPTRRAVVERLGRGPAATGDLAEAFRMSLPSFVQHLGVLETAGIVRSHKRGRTRTWELVPRQLQLAEDWMTTQRRTWERRLTQLDHYIEQLKETER